MAPDCNLRGGIDDGYRLERLQRQRVGVTYSVWMRVRVLYFGILKELLGQNGVSMEVAEGASVADLVALHRKLGKGAAELWNSLAVAVNQEYARAGHVLKDGDEVALLPPVSGGCEAGTYAG